MKRPQFLGAFFLHPVFLVAMALLLLNNLWLKPSGLLPLLAGKLSDISIMIFLPALICLAWEAGRYGAHTIAMIAGKDKEVYANETYHPSKPIIISAIAISALLMTLLQFSETASCIYVSLLNGFNDLFFSGRRIAEPVPDATDLVSILFAVVPYTILSRGRPT